MHPTSLRVQLHIRIRAIWRMLEESLMRQGGGATSIRLEYFELTGLAEARLTWTSGGNSTTPPPQTGGFPQTATMVNANYLNVRSGPGLEFEPITYLSRGQRVEVLGRDLGSYWIQIRTESGTMGWASSRYLSASAPFANLPVTE